MKTRSLLSVTFFAFAGLAFMAPDAGAAALAYTNGDLFLGFHATGGTGATQTYLVNIGQGSIFRDAAFGSSRTLTLGNIGTDLAAVYGSNWFNRADLFWGVAGGLTPALGGDADNTLYASREESQPGTLADGWLRRSNNGQTTTISKIQGLASSYLNAGNSTANSNVGLIQNTSDANNWASFQPGGANATGNVSFGAFNPTVEGDFGDGVAGTRLDLFRMTPSTTTGVSGDYEGTFTISSTGAVRYDVVPEPSILLLVSGGACLLGAIRRRKEFSHHNIAAAAAAR